MIKPRFLLLLPLLLLVLPSLAYASVCGSVPSGASYCQQLSIQNTQSSATTANTQIMLSYNALAYQSYLAANLMNIEAYNSVSGALIPMWLEGNVLNEQQTSSLYTSENIILWLKVPDVIAASSTDSNIYLAYFPTTTDEFSATGNYGAAPQLYCASGCPATSYGGVDNGNVVFNAYFNFAGTSTPSGMTASGATFNNGASVPAGDYAVSTASFLATNYVEDTYGYITMPSSNGNNCMGWAEYPTYSNLACLRVDEGTSATNYFLLSGSGSYPEVATTMSDFSSPFISSIWVSSTEVNLYNNYILNTQQASLPTAAMTIGVGPGGGVSGTAIMTWIRARVAPPNNVQPTVTFGSLQSPATLSLTFTPSSPITYGTSVSATATCTPSTDSCAVQQPLGTNLCTGTGSCTYSIPNYLAAGSYTYYANDLTLGTNQPETLTVNKATPLLYFNSPLCQTQVWTGTPCTTTAIVNSLYNQVIANFYLNNNLLGLAGQCGNYTYCSLSDTENSIGVYAYTFNTLGNGNYLAASNTLSYDFYENVYAKNVLSTGAIQTTTFAYPTSPFTYNTYYPIKLYTSSPVNTLSYSLYQILGASTTLLQSNVINVSYIPPANQPTGNYIYSLDNFQQGDSQVLQTVIAANVLNMTDITGPFTFNSPIIQYYENPAYCPTWTVPPVSWSIQSDNPSNQHSNQSNQCLDLWSNLNVTFKPKVSLTYNSFSPFTANLLNNPLMTNSITQDKFLLIGSNAPLASQTAPYTRILINWSSSNQYNLKPQNTLNTYISTFLINNYTFTANTTFNSTPRANIYIPQSNFQNPSVFLSNQSSLTTATNFYKGAGNYCPSTIGYGSKEYISPYLVDTNGSINEFEIYQNSQYLPPGYYIIVEEATGSGAIQVQSYQMQAIPFGLPLEKGVSYKFVIKTPGCTAIAYTSALSIWTSPISLTIPNLVNITPAYNYTFTSACGTYMNGNQLTLRCNGTSTNQGVRQWTVDIYNATGLLGFLQLLNQTNFSSTSFTFTYPLTLNNITYAAKVYAATGKATDPIQLSSTWVSSNTIANFLNAGGAIFALLFVFILAFAGYSRKSLAVLLLDFGLYIGGALDFLPISTVPFFGILLVSIVLIFLFERAE